MQANREVQSIQISLQGESLKHARRETLRTRVQHLQDGTRWGNLKAYVKAYIESRKFRGPHFRASSSNFLNVAITAQAVHVGYWNKASDQAGEYVYPLSTVGRVKTIDL